MGSALPPVLYLGDHFGYASGVEHGATVYTLNVLPALVEAGVEVVPCFLREPHPAAAKLSQVGIETIFLSAHPYSPLVVRQVAAIARRSGCGIIHSAGIKGTLVGRVVAPIVGARSLIHVHDQIDPGRAVGALHRLCARAHDSGIGVSRSAREVLIEGYHVRPDRAHVLYNGVRLERFGSVAPEARTSVRHELGIPDGAAVLTLIGRMHPIKGHKQMLDMMPLIVRENPHAVLLIIGDGPERVECEKTVRRLGLDASVRFLGHRQDVPELLAASDVLVVPSVSEGLSLAAIEAMAAGRPVVANRVGGLPEVIDDRKDGVLVEPGDARAFAAAVLGLLADPGMREEYGRAGRIAAERYSLARHIESLIGLYGDIVGERA